MDKKVPLYQMYSQREDFVIVALTGITGSGCSAFAEAMAKNHSEWEAGGLIRPLEEVQGIPIESKQQEVFKREYQRCYQFSVNYEPFQIIRYKNVLTLYLLRDLLYAHSAREEALEAFAGLLSHKFHHGYKHKERYPYEINSSFTPELIFRWGLTNDILEGIEKVIKEEKKADDEKLGDKERTDSKNEARRLLGQLFFRADFESFCNHLYEELKQRDYYAKNFFVHRLASAIRATGSSEKKYEEFKDSHDSCHVFMLVELINQIIKGYHLNNPRAPRRFVIDSIRNSMEILYLRERYNAFYMIAIHNDGHEKALLRQKVAEYAEGKHLDEICENINDLSYIEKDIDDFEEGQFFSPDLSRCVSESDLHIAYHTQDDLRKEENRLYELMAEGELEPEDVDLEFSTCSFYTYTEQWMKYSSLISRPGLVTPTRDERCMSIAHVAKFNSGCISRQVGCAIVDKENAIQSVGWNDPPAPQLPCNLRDVSELMDVKANADAAKNKEDKDLYKIYSKFELTDDRDYPKKKKNEDDPVEYHGKGFCGCLDNQVNGAVVKAMSDEGLFYPYCFRSRYNTYINNKDAVNTRSLHAEENTMLRLARQGGIGLKDGTMYVTASPCILCSKKAYQIGICDIVYLDPYTDIAPELILNCGFDIPRLRAFRGAIGSTFYKLYQPFMPYKDEITIWEKTKGIEK